MKRHLRPILAAVALLGAPLAWSQSGNSTYPTSSDQQPAGSTSSSQSGYSTYSSSSDQPQSGSAQSTYSTYPATSNDPQQQAGSSDGSQNGAPAYNWAGNAQQQGGSLDPAQNGGGGDGSQSGLGDGTQSGLGGPQDTFTHPETLPALNLFSDQITHTGYSLSFSGGAVAQYVGGYNNAPGYWDSLFLTTGGINITQSRQRVLWTLGYSAGVNQTVGTTYSNYSNLNQTANGHIIWQIAKRWQFRLKDTYFYSDDPFQPFFTFLGQPQPNYPNPVLYFPQSVVEQNQGTGELTYILGPHDSLNFYGAESFQHFLRGYQTQSSLPNFGSLWDSTTYSGGVFYQHQFSPKLSLGGGYIFTALDFGHGQSRAGTQMFQGNISYKISRSLSFTFWAGPQLTHTKDLIPLICFPSGCLIQVVHQSSLNAAEGGTLTWVAPHRNILGMQFSNSITNGGGLFGAVKYYSATATYARPINRVWNFAAGGLYAHSDSITNFQGDQYLHSVQGTVNFARKLNEDWNLNAYYVFIHQTQNYYGLYGVPVTVSTSGLGLTVQYTWNHSLGR